MKNETLVQNINPFYIYALDDDEDERLLISSSLNDFTTCRVFFFKEPENLLAELATSSFFNLPIFILLDLGMPRMNGFEVLQAIRSDPKLRSIPVLMLSGNSEEQIIFKAYELGANAFMIKPNTFWELKSLLKTTYMYWLEIAKTPKQFYRPVNKSAIFSSNQITD